MFVTFLNLILLAHLFPMLHLHNAPKITYSFHDNIGVHGNVTLGINGWLTLQTLKSNSYFTCSNESPLKMMKNAFYFVLKALFVLKIFRFLSWLFGHVDKTAWLER